jgi:hypothetical protein
LPSLSFTELHGMPSSPDHYYAQPYLAWFGKMLLGFCEDALGSGWWAARAEGYHLTTALGARRRVCRDLSGMMSLLTMFYRNKMMRCWQVLINGQESYETTYCDLHSASTFTNQNVGNALSALSLPGYGS